MRVEPHNGPASKGTEKGRPLPPVGLALLRSWAGAGTVMRPPRSLCGEKRLAILPLSQSPFAWNRENPIGSGSSLLPNPSRQWVPARHRVRCVRIKIQSYSPRAMEQHHVLTVSQKCQTYIKHHRQAWGRDSDKLSSPLPGFPNCQGLSLREEDSVLALPKGTDFGCLPLGVRSHQELTALVSRFFFLELTPGFCFCFFPLHFFG